MAKDPADRFQSADEMVKELAEIEATLGTAAVAAPRQPPAAPARPSQPGTTIVSDRPPPVGGARSSRRGWACAGAGVAGLLLMCLAGGVLFAANGGYGRLFPAALARTATMTVAAALHSTSTAPPPAATSTQEPVARPSATSGPQPTAPPVPTAAPTAFQCADPLGCVDIGPGAPIHLAYLLALSGANASVGIEAQRGAELAIDQLGGHLLGHPVEFDGQDSGCSAELSGSAAQKLTQDHTIVAVVGPSCTSEAHAVAPMLSEAGFTFITPSCTGVDLTDPALHAAGLLRTIYSDNDQGRVAAEFAYQVLGVRSAAAIQDESRYSQQLSAVFSSRFEQLGGQILPSAAISSTTTNLRTALTSLAAEKPELVYLPLFVSTGGLAPLQAQQLALLPKAKFLGGDGLYTNNLLSVAGKSAVGMYLTAPDLLSFGSAYADLGQAFADKYGQAPQAAYHAFAYDAIGMIYAAISHVAVAESDGTVHIGRQALRAALFGTTQFSGVTGTLTCTPEGDCADAKIGVYEVKSADPSKWDPGSAGNSNPKRVWPAAP